MPGLDREMLKAKERKRQATLDRQLLENRVALLKREEERALRKIKLTKERAQKILDMRAEQERQAEERQMLAREAEEKRREEAERLHKKEERAKEHRQKQAQLLTLNKRDDVIKVRKEAAKAREVIKNQKLDEIVDKKQKRTAIKLREDQLRKKKQIEFEAKKNGNLKLYQQKLDRELAETKQKEKEVAKMEKMEMLLIQKLKKTQIQQVQAFEHLEQALHTPSTSSLHKSSSLFKER